MFDFKKANTHDGAVELIEELVCYIETSVNELLDVRTKSLRLQTKYTNALEALLKIKSFYPHVFEECVTEDLMTQIIKPKEGS